MKLDKEVENFIDLCSSQYWNEFIVELNTDENKDYRRGFKAGLLCAHLRLKSQICKILDETNEQGSQ